MCHAGYCTKGTLRVEARCDAINGWSKVTGRSGGSRKWPIILIEKRPHGKDGKLYRLNTSIT